MWRPTGAELKTYMVDASQRQEWHRNCSRLIIAPESALRAFVESGIRALIKIRGKVVNDVFMDLGSVVTVAVALDRHSLPLTAAGVAICQRTGKQLCLLHVVEPWAEIPPSRPLGASDPLWDVTQAVERDARDKAVSRLDELASTVPPEISVITRVVSAKAVDGIVRELTRLPSCLLLVGASYGNVRFLPRGLSTALSLMVTSPVPVLIIDTTKPTPLLEERTRILVADDLGDQTATAVEYAFAFGAAVGGVEVRHVHVNGLSLSNLRAGLETAAATSHTVLDSTESAERVFDALLVDLSQRLAVRAENQREYLEAAGGLYTSEVRTGNVFDQLEASATAFGPNLMVFGRHQAYHTQPFFVGRVPYRSMLSYQRPLLIVPSA